jgi:hypothetical protein
MRAIDRTRAFNFYLRRLGLKPDAIGLHPSSDAAKSSAMRVALPARNRFAAAIRRNRR